MSIGIGGGGRNYQLSSRVYHARTVIRSVNRFAFRNSIESRVLSSNVPNYLKTAIKNKQNGSISDMFQTGESSATSDYAVRASKNLKALNDDCSKFNETLEKKLKAAGIPNDISFEFDYDITSGKAVITDISDEKYLDSLQSVLDGIAKTGALDYIGKSSRMMNGNMASAYYPDFESALKKCFGQDISKLSIDKNGNIEGANTKLQRALSLEKYNRSFDAQKSYGFPSKQLEAMIKRFLSDEGISDNVSHMGYNKNGLYTDDGDIKLGSKADPSLQKNSKYILKAAFASKTPSSSDYDYWLKNEDLFD